MRNMSFSMTTEAVRDRSKTVTRRLGWWNLKPGTILQAVEKAQGLKRGEHVKPICLIRVVRVSEEPLDAMIDCDPDETAREGFPNLLPVEFVEMFQKAHARDGLYFDSYVNRIEFEYLP
jgi:hypothetical protein